MRFPWVKALHTVYLKARRLRYLAPLILVTLGTVSGCGSDSGSNPGTTVSLPHLNDITTAPATIQKSAKAVVRLRVARGQATGAFISSTGLLLTNNHVLGIEVCPVEGCYVEVAFDWQAGSPYQSPRLLFAVPKAVDVGLDMAVVQFYEYAGGPMLSTPDYLTFQSQSPESLIGMHVTVVGHPEGCLKKWADGTVAHAFGDWISSTTYILPGDSGSPILNDQGKIVGICHRGPTSEDLFTGNGVNIYSIGTASAPLLAALNAPLPTTMISKTASTTTEHFLAYDLVYLNSRTTSVTVDGAPASPLSVLGQACDTALSRNDFISPDDLTQALKPCFHAQSWIECRSDASQQPYGSICPSGADATAWSNRFKKMNQAQVDMNGKVDLYSVSVAIARLQPTMQSGLSAGSQALQQAVSQANPILDFSMAGYLAEFNIPIYQDKNILDYVTHYRQDKNYQLQGSDIANAQDWLTYRGFISRNDFLSFLSQLHGDASSSVGTKLFIEDIQHSFGAL